LNSALEQTLAAYEARGDNEAEWVHDAAANLIVEAHNQGIRDEEALAHYALKALKLSDRRATKI